MVRKGCEALKQCEEMISKLGLFSANESKDGISTINLKYLLVILWSSLLPPFHDVCLENFKRIEIQNIVSIEIFKFLEGRVNKQNIGKLISMNYDMTVYIVSSFQISGFLVIKSNF